MATEGHNSRVLVKFAEADSAVSSLVEEKRPERDSAENMQRVVPYISPSGVKRTIRPENCAQTAAGDCKVHEKSKHHSQNEVAQEVKDFRIPPLGPAFLIQLAVEIQAP